MSLIIIGKVVGSSIGLCLVAMSGWYMVDPTTIDNWMAPLYSAEVYGFLTETTQPITLTAGTTITSKKLKCQIATTAAKFNCTVEEVDKLTDITKNTKKHISLKEFSTSQSSKAVTSALVAAKLYKITSSELNVDDQDWKTKPIKVFDVSGTSSDTKTELGSITPMFIFQGRVKKFAGTTHSFVGQASAELPDNSSYKCAWDKNTTELKDCTIMPFVANDDASSQSESAKITDLTFTKDSTLTSNKKIIKHHYYLIKFTNPTSDSKELGSFADAEIIYAKDSTGKDKITFGKLSAVTVVEDQLLILK